ncbi:MAG: hypothetical protein QT05_C0003G0017 [archaeon GW2011_AR13]|nr:MAG: hypothetical protein QT05_C0003G0017 [archaeon GW2011_AR13]HIG94218.1 DUF475 domain-containing protein [Nanoarchaeota archaeon]HIH62672.1 DUF475 domain-containing protein [Nanoarchaeota archaeon]HIJ09879.1 DUF475 domain-containing protein [Nanoarchaeota archaeon]
MDIITIMLIILGLVLFEIISSIDNAIINAEVLSTMSAKAKRWFLFWGILFAVFVVRGVLPFIIFWMGNPSLSIKEVFTLALSSDPAMLAIVEASAPVLLIGGGVFLIFLFFHWLFLESKHYGLRGEKYIERHGVWFFAVISIILSIIVWLSIKINPLMAFSAVLGSTVFFITHGFKENAAKMEAQMLEGKASMSDMSKIFYLEVIDMTFSIDGVLGAFAFTLFVPLILIGNGVGAIIVRQLTVKGINEIKKYKYLKNGAMYSIFLLGLIMIFDSFGFNIPSWASPIATFAIVGFFFYKSKRELK